MRSILPLAALAAASSLHAQTWFTFSGTDANSQPMTVTFVTSDNPLVHRALDQTGAFYLEEDTSTDPNQFNSISGTGITGTWARPVQISWDPWSNMQIDPANGHFYFLIGADFSTQLSLSHLGTPLTLINFNGHINETFASLPATFNFGNVWSNFYGTYTINDGTSQFEFVTASGAHRYFNFNTFTIGSSAPVPEPSTYGLALGGLALAGAALRRRARK